MKHVVKLGADVHAICDDKEHDQTIERIEFNEAMLSSAKDLSLKDATC